MDIEVLEVRILDNSKPLKAFADVKLNKIITVRDFRIVKLDDKRPFIATPQISWRDNTTGQIRYKTIISLSDEVKGAIDLAILTAYNRKLEEENGKRR